jgi:nitroreductase
MASLSESVDLIGLLRGLRQNRSFTGEPVDEGALDAILEVARWTGSGGNKQPWRLVVVRDGATIRAIAELKADTGWLANAPVVMGIATEGQTAELARFDAGRLVERIMLAATALELRAGIVGFGPPDSEPAQAARSLLNVPENLWLTHAIAIGNPGPKDQDPGSKKSGRKLLTEIVIEERFP